MRKRQQILIALASVLLALTAMRLWTSRTAPDELRQLVSRLAARPAEGRLSGSLPYLPWKQRTRGVKAETRAALMSLLADGKGNAAAALFFAGDAERSLLRFESQLATSDEEEPLGDRIERTVVWRVLNDVAAAAHAVAASGKHGDELLTAVAAAARAYKLEPRSAEARWNRALTLNALGLTDEARNAWQDYLAIDAHSEWSAEARERLAVLDHNVQSNRWNRAPLDAAFWKRDIAAIAAIAARFPLHVKTIAEQEWIPRGVAQVIVESTAHAIRAAAGDEQLDDFLAAQRAAADPSRFAAAHARLGNVRATLEARGTAAGIELLRSITQELRAVHSPLAATASIDLAGQLYHASRHEEALQELDRIDLDRMQRWPLLTARAFWNRGVALTSIGEFGRAGAAYRRSLATYEKTGDLTHAGMLRMLIGHNAEMAGDLGTAWSFYVAGLRDAIRRGDPDRVLVILDTFCRAALRYGYRGAATVLNDALLSRLGANGFAPYLCHALITRCDIEVQAGDRAAAAAQCGRAREIWASIGDQAVRDRLEADLELSSAAVGTASERCETLTRAVEVSTARNDVYRLARVLQLRGEALEELGQARLARENYQRALEFIEAQRAKFESVDDKLTYFETSEKTASSLVRLLVRTGDTDGALAIVERVRARALLERIARTSAVSPLAIDAIRSRLDAGRAIVEYWADRDRLYVWVIRREGVRFVEVPVAKRMLQSRAAQFVAAIAADESPNTLTAADALHADLIAPLHSALAGAEVLTFVPDHVIGDVPFAALRDPATKRYIVERFATTRAPSASAFIAARELMSRRDSILIVANPETTPPLPMLEVGEEIDAARRAVRRAVILTGTNAHARALRSVAREFDVVHLATHALVDGGAGEPVLLLSPERAGDDGLFTSSEIENTLPLRRGAMVVVAACSTARGRRLAEGTMSIARSFIAAGAGSVIASLWDVGDVDSARTFAAFYSALERGMSPAAALRTAQLSLLDSRTRAHPGRWAAYQIHGGA
jgi:CHAT domain-containing protein